MLAGEPYSAADTGCVILDCARIETGDDVQIGPGVHIGTGSVIGAASVVVRDIPPGVLAAGNPCRAITPIAVTGEDGPASP